MLGQKGMAHPAVDGYLIDDWCESQPPPPHTHTLAFLLFRSSHRCLYDKRCVLQTHHSLWKGMT
jgi:hypothetical protein